jgi:predicted membrane channel-forming protein YqfA (hemolysin III family)
MDILLKSHAHFRWIVVLVAIVALLGFLLTWLQKKDSKLDRTLMAIFLGCLDLQWLMGLILFIYRATSTGLSRLHWEHAVILTLAVALGHFSAKWKQAPTPIRARNYLFVLLGVIVLIFIGVGRYPNGWPMG